MLYLSHDPSPIALSDGLYLHIYEPSLYKPPENAVAVMINGKLAFQFSDGSHLTITRWLPYANDIYYRFSVYGVEILIVSKTTYTPFPLFLAYTMRVADMLFDLISINELHADVFPKRVLFYRDGEDSIMFFTQHGADVEIRMTAEHIDDVERRIIDVLREYDSIVCTEQL